MTTCPTVSLVAVFIALFVLARHVSQAKRRSAGWTSYLGAPAFASISAIIFAGVAILAARNDTSPSPWGVLALFVALCAVYLFMTSGPRERENDAIKTNNPEQTSERSPVPSWILLGTDVDVPGVLGRTHSDRGLQPDFDMPMSLTWPAGKVYEQLVAAVAAAEFDRKKALEGRGTIVVTTSTSLLTLIFGLTAVVTGSDHMFKNRCAVELLIASLSAFLVSAVIAIFIAAQTTTYKLPALDTIMNLTGDDCWHAPEDDARRMWVDRQAHTIKSLREGNNRKAEALTWSLGAQVLAIALLSASVAIDLRTWL
ncbi:hypothetical protein [Mycolicibacterium sp. HS_4_1]